MFREQKEGPVWLGLGEQERAGLRGLRKEQGRPHRAVFLIPGAPGSANESQGKVHPCQTVFVCFTADFPEPLTS